MADLDEGRQGERVHIEKVPDDCLSVIFEFSGKMDWRQPYRLQRVCRRWRTLLDHTPRAWSSIQKFGRVAPAKIFRAIIVKTAKVPLHVAGSSSSYLPYLSEIQHRICCLSLDATVKLEVISSVACFPLLRRLRATLHPFPKVEPLSLDRRRFPALRHLELEPHRDVDFEMSSPGLESCILRTSPGSRLESLVRSSQSTLTYLNITYMTVDYLNGPTEISLPRLRHLSITLQTSGWYHPKPFTSFRTPVLDSYEQHIVKSESVTLVRSNTVTGTLIHADVELVTRAKTDMSLSLRVFISLDEIVLSHSTDVDEMLESIELDPSVGMRLRRIVFVVEEDMKPDGSFHKSVLKRLEILNRTRPYRITFEIKDATHDPFNLINSFGRCDYSTCQ